MTTREQRNAYIRDTKDEINREFGPLAILVFLNFALTTVSLIAWGFGAPNMLWVALILAALTIHLFIAFRKRVREHVDKQLSETR